ncbi:hypothetical protein [Lentzea sp.]|uniref:hypothetical protein n=1 Tax=Lentzea sp. TaxID=56099 RepID=UPI002BCDF22C|nr:hypothetical protein [Lentzea sp.]HUQ61579.1 hypothetical protein [Lentzea sp.]
MTNNIAATNTRTRALLWTGLVLSALINAVVQTTGISTVVGIAFGVLALLFGAGLVVHYRKR